MKKFLVICIYFSGILSSPGQNMCGLWNSYEYPCIPGVENYETFSISQTGSYLVCTKIVGDGCVTSGQISWEGNFIGSVFPIMIHVGNLSSPDCCYQISEATVIDDWHIIIAGSIDIWRLSCHQVDSLQLKFSDYGLNCDCHAIPGQIKLGPNPFNSVTYIQNNSGAAIANVKIFNEFGQPVFYKDSKVQEINLSTMPSGVYFYDVETDSQKHYTGKIIKI